MEIVCPACAGRRWSPWRSADRASYLRCDVCGLARLDPFPTREDLAGVFDDGYFLAGGARGGYDAYDADSLTHRVNARHRLDRLDRLRGSGQPCDCPVIVDVGCASGYTLDVARERGWRAVGVEVSPAVAQRARARGHRVVANLDDLLVGADDPAAGSSGGESLAGRVEAICFFQVLEHLPDPCGALAAARRLLRPGGVVVCETWDGDSRVARICGERWQQLSPPSVLWVLDRPSARALTARAGLHLTDWRPTSKLVSVGQVAGQLGPRLPAPLAWTARVASRRASGFRLRYGLGDLVTFSARPTDDPPDASDHPG